MRGGHLSYDLNTALAPCDHSQSRERYIVDQNDFRTLHLASNTTINMRAPVNSSNALQLFISGELVDPDDPIYGYTLLLDPNRIESGNQFVFKKILFNKQIRLIVPLIEVDYFTFQPFCIKCNGNGQLNDYAVASNGSLLHIWGTNKLVQECLRFILTSTCPFYPQYTCPIKSYIGQKFGVSITDADIANAITTSLGYIQQIQSAQRTLVGQNMDPFEMLKDITNVVAVLDSVNPTQVDVSLAVSSYGTNTTQPLGFQLSTTKSLQYYTPGGNN
jgi:hypothetical protein